MFFTCSKLLKSPHIQTILPVLLPSPKIKYFTNKLVFEDGDFTEIVWIDKVKNKEFENIVVLFHGIGGSIKSHYIQRMMKKLKEMGYLSVLMHFRGCAEKTNNTLRSYHAGEIEDARFFINRLKKMYPNSKLHAIGYSLGANMLLKLLASYKNNSPLSSAVCISTPLELEECTKYISKGLAMFYQKYLLKNLKSHLLQKEKKLDLLSTLNLSKERIKKINTIYEFDDIYTAPVFGFKNAHDYYSKNSSKQFLKSIQIPTLMIHAKDDPFIPSCVLPEKTELSDMIKLELSDNGGHVGFIQGSIFKPKFWLEKRIELFLKEY